MNDGYDLILKVVNKLILIFSSPYRFFRIATAISEYQSNFSARELSTAVCFESLCALQRREFHRSFVGIGKRGISTHKNSHKTIQFRVSEPVRAIRDSDDEMTNRNLLSEKKKRRKRRAEWYHQM